MHGFGKVVVEADEDRELDSFQHAVERIAPVVSVGRVLRSLGLGALETVVRARVQERGETFEKAARAMKRPGCATNRASRSASQFREKRPRWTKSVDQLRIPRAIFVDEFPEQDTSHVRVAYQFQTSWKTARAPELNAWVNGPTAWCCTVGGAPLRW
jgi:hypothetical protein